LIEDGACLLYNARTILCRTHGLPILSEYRGHGAIGFCQKNFKSLPNIPETDAIDLERLNREQTDVNQRFIRKVGKRLPPGDRFRMGEALLMEIEN